MKSLFLFSLATFVTVLINAQPGAEPKELKRIITLKMPPAENDSMPGKRGASVVWHPLQKKYYAAMAGNAGYPLAVFDATGTRISDDSLRCREDVRGFWYNPESKEIQGNCFNNIGWFRYKLNTKGMVTESEIFMEGMNQPSDQCLGAYHPPNKSVLFLNAGYVLVYSIKDGISDESVKIHWGERKEDANKEDEMETPETPADYNYTSLVFTGFKGSEIGFLNVTEKQIELYDFTNGYLTKILKLPDEAPVNLSFNFAYCNGNYWLFNMETRTWSGYK